MEGGEVAGFQRELPFVIPDEEIEEAVARAASATFRELFRVRGNA